MPPINNPDLGSSIRERREALNISLRTLAKNAGINAGALSRIESNQRVPGPATLTALATALNTPVGELLGQTTAGSLPDLTVYLRTKYDLSDDAIARMAQQLAEEYGSESGPLDGEDEVDDNN